MGKIIDQLTDLGQAGRGAPLPVARLEGEESVCPVHRGPGSTQEGGGGSMDSG